MNVGLKNLSIVITILCFVLFSTIVCDSGNAGSEHVSDKETVGANADHEGHDHEGHDHEGHDHEGCDHEGHDHEGHDHEGHDHEGHDHEGHDHEGHDHEGHDHEGHDHEGDDHSGHGHEGELVLEREAQQLIGLNIDTARVGVMNKTLVLPGRVDYNRDKLAHVTPRFSGVVREVGAKIGEYVSRGQVLAVIESNASLTKYEVTAPFSGRVIEKHATLGEFVSEERELFIVADLSLVWINCDVYVADVGLISTGMPATVEAVGIEHREDARVQYVSPVFSGSGGNGLVRMVLRNRDGMWRPGMFVRARFEIPGIDTVLMVRTEAVQTLDGESVVFTPRDDRKTFLNKNVVTGTRTPSFTQIVKGLRPGDPYISEGAFELKATIITSNMDPHAGHGH